MAWDKTKPVPTTNIIDTPTIFGDNWDALDDILDAEHYGMESPLSGRHVSGAWSVCRSTTTCGLTALGANVASGAIAWDTTLGIGRIARGTTDGGSAVWDPVHLMPHSRVSVYRNGDQTLVTSAATAVQFDTEGASGFDSLNEYDTSTYFFRATCTGVYLVSFQLSITPDDGGITYEATLAHLTGASATIADSHTYAYATSLDELTLQKFSTLFLTAGDLLGVYITPNVTNAGIINGGSNKTWLKVYRVS